MKIKAAAFCVSLTLMLSGCSESYPYDFSRDVFLIDDLHVTSGMVNILFYAFEKSQNDNYSPVYGKDFWDAQCYENPDMTYGEYEKEYIFFEDITNMFCLSKLWLVSNSLSDEDNKFISDISSEYYSSLDDEMISHFGIDENDVYEILKAYYTAEYMQQEVIKKADALISEEEVRVLTVLEISFIEESRANDFIIRLDEGNDVYSLIDMADTYTQRNLSRDDCDDESNLEAFSLRKGEHGSVFWKDNVYKVYVLLEPYQTELSEARKENLLLERQKQELKKICEEFKNHNEVYINQEKWDEYSFCLEELPDDSDLIYEYFEEISRYK